ncbi:MAG: NAD(P)-dependent oxidoreductase [bacterium]|nr:NAD(P)-dependent oxidoreductase [bacterium]
MRYSIAVLDNISLLEKAEENIQSVSNSDIVFAQEEPANEEDLIKRTGKAEIVLISPRVKITKRYIDHCPSVKYIGVCGTSLENVDRSEITKRAIVLTNVKDYGDDPAAEFIFMQLAMLLRGIGKYQWKDEPHELMGRTFGIIGLGALGQSIARLALAYKMRTRYFSPRRKTEWEEKGARYADIGKLLKTSEIVCISTPSNLNILGKKEFEHINRGSVVIQASMGKVFDHEAFLQWIARDGNYAIFDYSAGEENYQLYHSLPKVIFPKVVAGHSIETRQRLGEIVVEHLQSYFLSRSKE